MINEVLSLRHRIEEQLEQEYKQRKESIRGERKERVRQMTNTGRSLSNERKKLSKT